ncbi:type II secretion system protein GspK [Planctomycetota bacterium]
MRLRAKRRGFTLVLTIIVIVFVTIVVMQIRYATRIEWILTQNMQNTFIASYSGRSAIPLIVEKLRLDAAENQTDSLNDMWAQEITGMTVGEVSLDIKIMDEDGKFNINLLVDDKGNVIEGRQKAFERLLNSLEIEWNDYEFLDSPEALAEKIIDFIDDDEIGRYEERDVNPNRRILTLEELLNIEGIDVKFLYGEEDLFVQDEMQDDEYGDGYYDPDRGKDDEDPYGLDEEEETFEGLFPYISAYGNGGININTATVPVLMSISESLTQEIAEAIVAYRETSIEHPENKLTNDGQVKMINQVFENVNDLSRIEDVDEDQLKDLLDQIAPVPGKKKKEDDPDADPSGDAGDNAPTNRSTRRINVQSMYFTAVIETAKSGGKTTFVALIERDEKYISLRFWEQNTHIPQNQKEEDSSEEEG